MSHRDNTTPHSAAEYNANICRIMPCYEFLHREAIDLVATVMPQPAIWLDTGCGTGRLAELALPLFAKTRFVLADPSPAMLEEARKRLQGVAPERLSFVHAGTSDVRPDHLGGTPDVITAIMCHHYAQPQERRDMTRVCHDLLAPGGVYVPFENIRPDSPEATRIGLERWKRFQRAQGRDGSAVEQHAGRFGVEYFPITIREHVQLLQDCGFRTVQLLWFSYMQAGLYAIK
jgi:tRNA (cmo5U34)-methyltransferase